MKVALIGATGKAGKYVAKELLAQGFELKILLRHPDRYPSDPLIDPSSEIIKGNIIKGDIKDLETTRLLLKDCDVVISTIGQIKGEPLISGLSTENILAVMAEYGIKRYIYIAGLTIDAPGDKKSPHNEEMTAFMKRSFPEIVADKQRAFALLSASNVDWTLVRLPFITQTDAEGQLVINPEDCPGDHINTTDLAKFLVLQITDRQYIRKAPFVASV